MTAIDAHHHFWHYTPADYPWISAEMSALRRDFLPADLAEAIASAGVDGAVSVQARQSLDETQWLLDLAEGHDFVRGVVGWVPLVEPDVERHLEHFAQRPKLRGVRHVLHDEADDGYALRADFDRGVGLLRRFDLRYDVLIFERHLPQAIRLVDRHPDQVFILDHVAKPKIRAGEVSPWRERIADLARRPNVFCKISGMVTEADWHAWTPATLRPYLDIVLNAFGPRRLMFGSDWPVCLVASDYGQWHQVVSEFITPLSPDEQARIMGGTAFEAYGL